MKPRDENTEKQPAVEQIDVHSNSAETADCADTAECRCKTTGRKVLSRRR